MGSFVAYFRVSTDKQGRSGLGLAAQRKAVIDFVAGRGTLIAEFTEIESSRNHRPQLQAALEICRRKKCTLVIARLDRLARNVAFISNLMDSRVDFVAVDMPEANRLTIHILAAVAEHEREMISVRTKAALQAAKVRGVRLGNPNPLPASHLATKAVKKQAAQFRAAISPVIQDLHRQGLSLSAIARILNERNVVTIYRRSWYPTTIRNILNQVDK